MQLFHLLFSLNFFRHFGKRIHDESHTSRNANSPEKAAFWDTFA